MVYNPGGQPSFEIRNPTSDILPLTSDFRHFVHLTCLLWKKKRLKRSYNSGLFPRKNMFISMALKAGVMNFPLPGKYSYNFLMVFDAFILQGPVLQYLVQPGSRKKVNTTQLPV